MNQIKPLNGGDQVPHFTLNDHKGDLFNLCEVPGKKPRVAYFNPKNELCGFAADACAFRDHPRAFPDAGATVIRISSGGADSSVSIRDRHAFNKFLVPEVKTIRYTFVTGKNGAITNVFQVRFAEGSHLTTALQALRNLSSYN